MKISCRRRVSVVSEWEIQKLIEKSKIYNATVEENYYSDRREQSFAHPLKSRNGGR